MSEENQVVEEVGGEVAEEVKADSVSVSDQRLSFKGCKIKKLVGDNPRKPGTNGHAAWQLLQDGMTFEEYTTAGGSGPHLRWDWEHNWVDIIDKAGDSLQKLPVKAKEVKAVKTPKEAKPKKERKIREKKVAAVDNSEQQLDLTQSAAA